MLTHFIPVTYVLFCFRTQTFDNAMLYNEEESHVAKAAQALLGVFNSRWAQLEADWDAEEAKYAHLLAPAPPAETPVNRRKKATGITTDR